MEKWTVLENSPQKYPTKIVNGPRIGERTRTLKEMK